MTNEKWNRYPEEKPTKDGKYLVCRILRVGKTPYIDTVWWGKSANCESTEKAYWYVVDFDYGDYEIDNVYAWMPLPDPLPI